MTKNIVCFTFIQSLFNQSLSKLQLGCIVTLYLFLLNFVSKVSFTGSLSTFWLALLMLVISLVFSLLPTLFFKLFLASQIFIASIAVFVKFSYSVTLTTDIMLSGIINDNALTFEMLSFRFIMWLIITGVIPIILLFLIKTTHVSFLRHFIKCLLFSAISFGVILTYLSLGNYDLRKKGNIRDPKFATDLNNFSPLDAEYSFRRALRVYKKLKRHQANIKNLSQTYDYGSEIDDLLVVFIIGEATRGDHFEINGYKRKTNPKLANIKNLHSFIGAQSCDTLTANSVYCMASMLQKNDKERLPKYSSFGEVLKSEGYQTQIYSLQNMSEFYNYLTFDSLVSKYAVLREQQKGSKDIALLPYSQKAIDEYKSGKQLIVLHTLGSHQTYADRLMPENEIFKPYCRNPDVSQCEHDELNNAYDNTILAVDDYLAKVINQLKDKKALLIYASDHGESLGENGNYFHGKPINIAPAEQFSVPFVVWFSDKYLADTVGQKNAEQLKLRLEKNISDKYHVSHDNIFHSLLGCAGITSRNGINQTLNLCSHVDFKRSK